MIEGTVTDHETINKVNDTIFAVLLGLVELVIGFFALIITLFWVNNFEGSLSLLNDLLNIFAILNSLVNFGQKVKLVGFVFNLDESCFLGDVLDLLSLLLVGLTDLSSLSSEDFLEDLNVELSAGLDVIDDSLLNIVRGVKDDLLKNTLVVLLDKSESSSLGNSVLLLNVIEASGDLIFQFFDSLLINFFLTLTLVSDTGGEEICNGGMAFTIRAVLFSCKFKCVFKFLFLFIIRDTALIVNLCAGLFDEAVDIEATPAAASEAKAKFGTKLSLGFSTEANGING